MRGFFGAFIAFLLINIIIISENTKEENNRYLLESKQRIIDYQKIEQERIELQNEFEMNASTAIKFVTPGMETHEAKAIFCTYLTSFLEPIKCLEIFNIDVYNKKAVLKQDLILKKKNYQIIFQKNGWFE